MGKLSTKFIVGTVLTAIGIGVLLNLGMWQMHRLAWKTQLLEKIAAQQDVNVRTRPLADLVGDEAGGFSRGYLQGTWMRDQTVLVGPKMRDGAWGYWNITPLKLDDGRVVLVNRGWGEGEIKTSRHNVKAMGSLRESDPGGEPVGGDIKSWHKMDVPAIGKALQLDVQPLALFMEVSEPLDMAKPAPVTANLRNEHRNYAIFWFTMALALFGVYTAVSLRGRRSASSQGPSDL